jgi:hypothetical protein
MFELDSPLSISVLKQRRNKGLKATTTGLPLHAAKDSPRRLRQLTLLWAILLYAYVCIFSAGFSLLDGISRPRTGALSARICFLHSVVALLCGGHL